MVGAAEKTISEVDLICWLVEPTTHLGAAEEHIVEKLKECKTPIVLVINKTDTIKKEEILPVIDCYRKELDLLILFLYVQETAIMLMTCLMLYSHILIMVRCTMMKIQ